MPTIMITGPGGVGKTTVAFEISEQLQAAGVGHALLDLDELDRIFPAPPGDPHKSRLTKRNLAAVWTNLREAGALRLILTMVAVSVDHELPHIREAVPGASVTVVRLQAREDVLMERVRRRELGSGRELQLQRSAEQRHNLADEPLGDALLVETSGRPVVEIAREIIRRAGWQD